MNADDKIISKNIKRTRRLAGKSQEDVAKAIGISFQQVQKYENEVNRVSAGRLCAIANHLGVPVSVLLAGTSADENPEPVEMFSPEAAKVARLFDELSENAKHTALATLRTLKTYGGV